MSYCLFPRLLFTICMYIYADQLPRLGKKELFFSYRLLINLLFLFEGVSSSSGYLGKNALFYCGNPWAFRIIILEFKQCGISNNNTKYEAIEN